MRRFLISVMTVLVVSLAAGQVRAVDIHIDHDDCGFNSPYDVYVQSSGIRFEHDGASPQRVLIHDGMLQVDGKPVTVSSADAERLRRFEGDMRDVLPRLAMIARDALDIGFDAMTTAAATLSEGDQRQELIDRLNREHATALGRLDDSLGRGEWRHDALRELVEGSIKSTVPTLVSTLTAQTVKAALSGDHEKLAALEARADSLDESLDKQINARADKLEHRAKLLCPRVKDMQALQKQWQFRLADGDRLQLLRHND